MPGPPFLSSPSVAQSIPSLPARASQKLLTWCSLIGAPGSAARLVPEPTLQRGPSYSSLYPSMGDYLACRSSGKALSLHLRATSHTRLRARDHITSSTLIGGKGGAGPSSLPDYAWGTNGVYRCKVYVDSYLASNGSCFMVIWTIFKNLHCFWKPSLEVGLTQN
jgi:hypothetical protein